MNSAIEDEINNFNVSYFKSRLINSGKFLLTLSSKPRLHKF